MLTQKEVTLLRKELASAKNPLFFYDGDGDGLASFLLLYRIHREGKGVALRGSSQLNEKSLRKVAELDPDKIFVLDIPLMTQEFIDKAKRPIFWIDHHPPQDKHNVKYFNPRIAKPDAYIPTSRMCWQISDRPQDLWIAMTGCLADYYEPDFVEEFVKNYPNLLPAKIDLTSMVFKSPASKLVKMFFFLQKGPHSEVRKSVKILQRINHPDEILKEQTSEGKFLWKRFGKINKMYEELLRDARKNVTRSDLLLYHYSEDKWSFTANLANELVALYPKKTVLILRTKGGQMKCSLRGKHVLQRLTSALEGISGRGGGHDNACGAVIQESDWERFLENFKRELKNSD